MTFIKYEMSVLVRHLTKQKTLATLGRTARQIYKNEGHIYKVETQGYASSLPHRMRGDSKGTYAQFYFVAPTEKVPDIKKGVRYDPEVLRSNVFSVKPFQDTECSLEEELKPPALRKNVQQMIQEADDREPIEVKVKRFDPRTNLGYYPFAH